MRIYLRSLQLEAFRSVRDPLKFTFPERGFLLVKGKNLDTGGSSGAGKTNVFLGISLALGFCPFPGTELQCWDTDAKYRVGVDLFREDQGELEIVRSPSGGHVGGEKMAKSANAKLQTFLGGLSPEMLRVLTYAQQDDDQDFLKLDPKGKFDFLSQMFPEIAALEQEGDKADKKAAQIQAQLLLLKPQVLQLAQRVTAAQTTLDQLGGVEPLYVERDRLQEVVDALQLRKRLAQQATAQARQELDLKITDAIKRAGEVRSRIVQLHDETAKKTQAVEAEAKPQIDEIKVRLEEARWRVLEHQKTRIPNQTDVKLEQDPRFKELQDQYKTADKHCDTLYRGYEKAKSDAVKQRMTNALKQGQLKARVQAVEEAGKALPRLTKELERLEGSQCPTCTQPWVNADELARRKAEVLKLSTDLLEVAPLKQEIATLQGPVPEPQEPPQLARLQDIRRQIQEAMTDMISAETGRLQEAYKAETASRGAALAEVQKELTAALARLEERRQATRIKTPEELDLNKYEAQLHEEVLRLQKEIVPDHGLPQVEKELEYAQKQVNDNNRLIGNRQAREELTKKELSSAQAAAVEMLAQLEAKEAEYKLEADIGEVLSRTGFLSALFTEILDEIGMETNKILQQVANTAEVSLRFVSETENKSGKTERKIRAMATIRGHEAALRSGASGGMNTAVSLAVRFAVRAVASRRTGVYPAWVCLDEPFNGLGPVEKETCMEILKVVAEQDLVLVVDHGSEFQALFDQEIVLTMEKGITRFA